MAREKCSVLPAAQWAMLMSPEMEAVKGLPCLCLLEGVTKLKLGIPHAPRKRHAPWIPRVASWLALSSSSHVQHLISKASRLLDDELEAPTQATATLPLQTFTLYNEVHALIRLDYSMRRLCIHCNAVVSSQSPRAMGKDAAFLSLMPAIDEMASPLPETIRHFSPF